MIIQEKISLAQYTTFKIGGPAKFFCVVTNENELIDAVKYASVNKLRIFVIGGGSNILISDNGFDGLVIKMEIKGIEFTDLNSKQNEIEHADKLENSINKNNVIVRVGAGENWDDFVELAVSKGLYGIENLSSIPGTVGASAVQNIGAYGTEVSNVIKNVRALDTESLEFVLLSKAECEFSYRESIFKQKKGRYIILKIDFELTRNGEINLEYEEIKDYFISKNISNTSLQNMRDAIVDIRQDKLPDWKKWGTAGSFFKNPIISLEKYESLKRVYPELPGYEESDGRIKVSLGWILDKICDARGFFMGNVGTYDRQALVVVTKPGATATEVVMFSNELMSRVQDKTGIKIEGEVDWVVV